MASIDNYQNILLRNKNIKKFTQQDITSFLTKIFYTNNKQKKNITKSEFPQAIRKLILLVGGNPIIEEDIEDLFNLLDLNGDQIINENHMTSIPTIINQNNNKKLQYAFHKPKYKFQNNMNNYQSHLSTTLSSYLNKISFNDPSTINVEQNQQKYQKPLHEPVKSLKKRTVRYNLCKTQIQQMNKSQFIQQLRSHLGNVCKPTPQFNDISRQKINKQSQNKLPKNKQFLISQFSVKQIDMQHIRTQKSHFSKFTQLKSKKINKKDSIKNLAQLKDKGQTPKLFGMIFSINKIIEELQQLGYTRKSNKFIINFCKNSTTWLMQTFLVKSQNKKDIVSGKTKWKVKLSQQISNHFNQVLNQIPHPIIRIQLQKLQKYLEEILISRRKNQLAQVSDYIETQLNKYKLEDDQLLKQGIVQIRPWRQLIRTGKQNENQCDFALDLAKLQHKFGINLGLGSINRIRHQQLNKIQQRIHKYF